MGNGLEVGKEGVPEVGMAEPRSAWRLSVFQCTERRLLRTMHTIASPTMKMKPDARNHP